MRNNQNNNNAIRQSRESARGGYANAAQVEDNGFTSDVNRYTEVMDDEVIRGSV